MRVLVIEKEKNRAARVREALRQIWCDVDVWSEEDGEQGVWEGEFWEEDVWEKGNPELQDFVNMDYDAVILGSGLGNRTGLEILGRLRVDHCQLPVLMVTSGREERISGLEQGADYCLPEDFDERELLAALQAVLRRRGPFIPERLRYGELCLNQGNFILSGPGGSFQLEKREFEVIRTLMINPDMVVSKEFFLSRVWGDNPEAVENNVEVYISFLRKKLRALKAGVSIVTIRNLGYRLRIDIA